MQSLLVSHNIKPTLEQTFMSPLCGGNIVKQMMVETSCSILSGSVFEECKKFVSIGSCVSHSSILYDLCWHWLQLREKVWLCWERMGLGGGWLVFSSLTLSCSWCFMGKMHLYGMHYGKMHLWSNEITSAQGKFYCTAQKTAHGVKPKGWDLREGGAEPMQHHSGCVIPKLLHERDGYKA